MIGLLHPGQMGAAIGAELVGAGHEVLWVRSGRSEQSASRATEAGLRGVDSLAELVDSCEVVLSICPPAAAADVAAQVAGFGGIYVDCNAISPYRMIEISELFDVVIDGSIIGPPPGPSRGCRLYLSGQESAVERVVGLFAGTRAEPVPLGSRLGDASAVVAARAWRWGPEMLEAAESFAALGLPDQLAKGAATVFDRLSADKDSQPPLAEVLRHLRHE